VGHLRPDYTSIETLLQSPPLAGKQGEELVLAIYNLLTSTVDGTYHFWPSQETRGLPRLRRRVEDPVKLLNVYGWAICGQMSAILYNIYRAAGFPARQIGVPGHCLCEVFYDGRWHILDADMWTWFRTPEGHIASAYELAKNADALILHNPRKSDPCNLPDRTLEGYAEMYRTTETVEDHVRDILPHWSDRGHTMDFRLRPGETLIRSQTHQGRYHLPQGWLATMKSYPKEWARWHPQERYPPGRTFGNGRWLYAPDLTSATDDFRAGCWESDGLHTTAQGLAGVGHAVLRIQSPYLFCGRPSVRDGQVVSQDGVWLDVAGEGPLQIEIDTPAGGWTTVLQEDGTCEQHLDITAQMDGRYEALFRVRLGKGALLQRFGFDGFLLMAPLSVPRLAAGVNPMELRCGDAYGLCTVPWSEIIDFRAGTALSTRWAAAANAAPAPYVNGWQQVAPQGAGPVELTYRFDAPAGRTFAWAHLQASVREGPHGGPTRHARLAWSTDGTAWQEAASCELSCTAQQWDTSVSGDVRCKGGSRSLWLRLTSDTAITGVEFYGHLAKAADRRDSLRITHVWREGNTEKRCDAPPGARHYDVACGADPREHTIILSVPSRPK
jgi:hypothetical protein